MLITSPLSNQMCKKLAIADSIGQKTTGDTRAVFAHYRKYLENQKYLEKLK